MVKAKEVLDLIEVLSEEMTEFRPGQKVTVQGSPHGLGYISRGEGNGVVVTFLNGKEEFITPDRYSSIKKLN